MDTETVDGVLADMMFRRVDARRRDLLTDIALSEFNATGKIDPATVREKYAVLWVEPSAERLLDEIATKCNAAIEYHAAELAVVGDEIERASKKRGGTEEQRAAILADVTEADNATRVLAEQDDARVLLAAALAKGGEPGRAPATGSVRAQTPEPVVEAVEAILTEGI